MGWISIFGIKITDEDIITNVLNSLTREYEDLIDSIQIKIYGEIFSLKNLKEKFSPVIKV